MTGAMLAFENGGQRRDIHYKIGRIRRIDIGWFRIKDHVYTVQLAFFQIGIDRSGIFGEIFCWAKLHWIDEDTDDDMLGELPGLFDQRDMTGVQGAHRWYKSHSAKLGASGATFRNGSNQLHAGLIIVICKNFRY